MAMRTLGNAGVQVVWYENSLKSCSIIGLWQNTFLIVINALQVDLAWWGVMQTVSVLLSFIILLTFVHLFFFIMLLICSTTFHPLQLVLHFHPLCPPRCLCGSFLRNSDKFPRHSNVWIRNFYLLNFKCISCFMSLWQGLIYATVNECLKYVMDCVKTSHVS